MRTPDEVATMLRLHGLGWGKRRIAAEVGCNRETVQRYLASGRWRECQVPAGPNMLAGHADWIAERFRRHRGNADVVRQELASKLGVVTSLRPSWPSSWLTPRVPNKARRCWWSMTNRQSGCW